MTDTNPARASLVPSGVPAATWHRLAGVGSVRRIEHLARAGLPHGELMRRAGHAAAARIAEALARRGVRSGRIAVVAGPGDNGGDGRIAAERLRELGFDAVVVDAPHAPDSLAQAGDGAVAVVDALFGIGLARPIAGTWAEAVRWIEASGPEVLRVALDVPSGLDADRGCVVRGPAGDGVAVRVDLTVTFLADKSGLHTGAGRDLAGEVVVEPIGIDAEALLATPAALAPCEAPMPDGRLIDESAAAAMARALRRTPDSHKGRFGTVAVVGGSPGMAGAALLAGRAALHAGAGRIVVGFAGGTPLPVDPLQPELMLRDARVALDAGTVLAVGPGLGLDATAATLLEAALATDRPLVIDADALTLLARVPVRMARLAERAAQGVPAAVLTPHPLEAARLLDLASSAPIQADRIGSARRIAAAAGAVVLLKGAGTVIATPAGDWAIVAAGNPALATGGTGDLLTGLVAALLAQGLAPADAAMLAAWIHGRGADDWTSAEHVPLGATAAELLPAMRGALHRAIAA